METVICPKCGKTIAVSEGKDFVICCNDVIFVIANETYGRENERNVDDNNRQQTSKI